MAAVIRILQSILGFALPFVGFYAAGRRPGHTQVHLVVGATLGGGLSGAIVAAIGTGGGAPFFDVLPWALIGLLWGAIIGLVGVGAFALGRWLKHHS